MKLQGRIIADGLSFPEGPDHMPDGSVLVVEVAGGCRTCVLPSGKKERVAELFGGPNGAAIGPDGHCYVCNNGGFAWLKQDGFTRPHGIATDYETGSIQRVNLQTGLAETLYQSCGDIPLRGPNDIVFDKSGGFWFSDMGKTHGRVLDRGAVFYARSDGSLIKQAIFPIMTPNGVGLSPDQKTLYVSETETSRLWSYPIIGEGELEMLPWPSPNGGRLIHGLDGFQRFDSMALEELRQRLRCDAGARRHFSDFARGQTARIPRGARNLLHQPLLRGADRRTAYITLSGYGQLIAVPWKRPGLALNY